MGVSDKLEKLECNVFIPDAKDEEFCACGRRKHQHDTQNTEAINERWRSETNTTSSPSDAYGTIHFDGPEPNKAHFARMSSRSTPELVFRLMTDDWQLKRPKLIISAHGGKPNFQLAPHLKKSIRNGLVRTAKTTGAWIFTEGINTGISRRIGAMLKSERSLSLRGDRVICVGIAPWGAIENRHQFAVKNRNVVCSLIDGPRPHSSILNSCHSSFLLVDNGTVGRHGAEISFRRKLENYIMSQNLPVRGECSVPMVCLVIEGGIQTIRTVVKYASGSPPVPVVVCEGSGRAADLIAFVLKTADKKSLIAHSKAKIIYKIRTDFQVGEAKADAVFEQLMKCVDLNRHIDIFRPTERTDFNQISEENDLDKMILKAVLRAVNEPDPSLAAQKQLSLALSWNRVDVARSELFYYGQEWPEGALEEAMMYALDKNRIDFVKLFIEKGVQMTRFLTIPRLEELYNSKSGPPNTLQYIIRQVRGPIKKRRKYTLIDIGLAINELMGGTFRSLYTKKAFRTMYKFSQMNARHSSITLDSRFGLDATVSGHPFNDLLIWAVLTKRQDMAKLMWEYDGQILAKALVACNLYKALANEAAEDVREVEHYEDFNKCFAIAKNAALDLFESCYKYDADLAKKLLTTKWSNWSRQSCLQLAHACGHQELIAHSCSQWILTDIWLGGMRARKSINLKVISSILFFPLILTWEYPGNDQAILFDEEYSDEETPPGNSKNDTEANPLGGKQEPNVFKKFSIFYNSPISTFWADVFAYIAFLAIFTYTMLGKLPRQLHWNEYYVIAYIGTFGCDLIRQVLVSKSTSLARKFDNWNRNLWNICDASAVMFFFLALCLRLHPLFFDHGRILYCLNILYWYIRIVRLFAVSKLLGPFVTMIFKMIRVMVQFIALLLVVISAYGVFRQALLFPNEEQSWKSIRNVFFEPHLMIYGELSVDSIDPPCGGHDESECIPGHWLNPLVMAGFLMISSVLLLNVLIAIFNSIYEDMNVVTHQIWKFNRYAFVVEYKKKPNLPPPIIILSHVYLIFASYLKWDAKIDKEAEMDEEREKALTENEDQDEMELLDRHLWPTKSILEVELEDFEATCFRELVRNKNSQRRNSEENYQMMDDKTNALNRKLDKCYARLVDMESNLNLERIKPALVEGISSRVFTDSTDGPSNVQADSPNLPLMKRRLLRQHSVPEEILRTGGRMATNVQIEARNLWKLEEEDYELV